MLRSLARRVRTRGSDAGITLIELCIGACLSLVVLGILAGMFTSTTNAEAKVRGLTTATTASQLAWNAIDRSTRNSSAMSVSSVGSDMVVSARTVGSAATAVWGCTAFYYSASDKTIRYTTSATAITLPTSTAGQRSWTLLADNVTKTGTTAVFAIATNTAGSQTLTTTFTVMAGGTTAANVSEKSSNAVLSSGDPTCF
jgi:Tfp pilus assembly protein PilW